MILFTFNNAKKCAEQKGQFKKWWSHFTDDSKLVN
jgi:hypothetical protein